MCATVLAILFTFQPTKRRQRLACVFPLRTLCVITCNLLLTFHWLVLSYTATSLCKKAEKGGLHFRCPCALLKFKSLLLSKSFLSAVERRENRQMTSSLCGIFICGFLRLPEVMFMKLSNKYQPFWKRKKNFFFKREYR